MAGGYSDMLKYRKMQAPMTEAVAAVLAVMAAHAPGGVVTALLKRAR